MRAVLLSDPQVSRRLQDEVVFCWESVRPVPKVSIDFGNGKTLTRTLKGNTVFYLCLPDGRVLDAFPGVYTPQDFLAQLDDSLELYRSHPSPGEVVQWHLKRRPGRVAERIPTTVSKSAIESPVLARMDLVSGPQAAVPASEFAAWCRRLHDRSHDPMSREEARQGLTGPQLVQLDSRQNVQFVRPGVHLLLSQAPPQRPDHYRDVIFKDLLQVPIDDPYLGLGTSDVPGTP